MFKITSYGKTTPITPASTPVLNKKKNSKLSALTKLQNSFFKDLKDAFLGTPKQYEIVYERKFKYIPFFSNAIIREVKIIPTTRQKILNFGINRYTAAAIAILTIANMHFKHQDLMADTNEIAQWSSAITEALSGLSKDLSVITKGTDSVLLEGISTIYKSFQNLSTRVDLLSTKYSSQRNTIWVLFGFNVLSFGISATAYVKAQSQSGHSYVNPYRSY